MGIKDEVAEIIRGNKANPMNENKSTRIHNLYLSAMVLEGVEKYRECLECKGKGHQHCVAMSGIPYVAPCDHCETGEIVEPILLHECDFYCDRKGNLNIWQLKIELKGWSVRSVK